MQGRSKGSRSPSRTNSPVRDGGLRRARSSTRTSPLATENAQPSSTCSKRPAPSCLSRRRCRNSTSSSVPRPAPGARPIIRGTSNTPRADRPRDQGAALAAGFATLAMGSDMGGSIRIPASQNGLYGFRPPFGRVAGGEIPYSTSGPLARRFDDLVHFQNAIVGPSEKVMAAIRPRLDYPSQYPDLSGMAHRRGLGRRHCRRHSVGEGRDAERHRDAARRRLCRGRGRLRLLEEQKVRLHARADGDVHRHFHRDSEFPSRSALALYGGNARSGRTRRAGAGRGSRRRCWNAATDRSNSASSGRATASCSCRPWRRLSSPPTCSRARRSNVDLWTGTGLGIRADVAVEPPQPLSRSWTSRSAWSKTECPRACR